MIVINGIEYRVVDAGHNRCFLSCDVVCDDMNTCDVSHCTTLVLTWDLFGNNIVPPLHLMPNVKTLYVNVRECNGAFAELLINYYINCLADLGLVVEMQSYNRKNVLVTDVFQLRLPRSMQACTASVA